MQGDIRRAHRKRCKRWDIPYDAHCLTFSCFRSQCACRWFLEALGAVRTRQPFDLWAYVIMPEHVHIALRPPRGLTVAGPAAAEYDDVGKGFPMPTRLEKRQKRFPPPFAPSLTNRHVPVERPLAAIVPIYFYLLCSNTGHG